MYSACVAFPPLKMKLKPPKMSSDRLTPLDALEMPPRVIADTLQRNISAIANVFGTVSAVDDADEKQVDLKQTTNGAET